MPSVDDQRIGARGFPPIARGRAWFHRLRGRTGVGTARLKLAGNDVVRLVNALLSKESLPPPAFRRCLCRCRDRPGASRARRSGRRDATTRSRTSRPTCRCACCATSCARTWPAPASGAAAWLGARVHVPERRRRLGRGRRPSLPPVGILGRHRAHGRGQRRPLRLLRPDRRRLRQPAGTRTRPRWPTTCWTRWSRSRRRSGTTVWWCRPRVLSTLRQPKKPGVAEFVAPPKMAAASARSGRRRCGVSPCRPN